MLDNWPVVKLYIFLPLNRHSPLSSLLLLLVRCHSDYACLRYCLMLFPLRIAFLLSIGTQAQQLTLIPASALANLTAQQGNMMRGVGSGSIMQLQPAAGMNTTNGFLQSIPVQNIPGLGNVQVIPASALQPATVQTLPATAAAPIVTAPTVQLDSNDRSCRPFNLTIC